MAQPQGQGLNPENVRFQNMTLCFCLFRKERQHIHVIETQILIKTNIQLKTSSTLRNLVPSRCSFKSKLVMVVPGGCTPEQNSRIICRSSKLMASFKSMVVGCKNRQERPIANSIVYPVRSVKPLEMYTSKFLNYKDFILHGELKALT